MKNSRLLVRPVKLQAATEHEFELQPTAVSCESIRVSVESEAAASERSEQGAVVGSASVGSTRASASEVWADDAVVLTSARQHFISSASRSNDAVRLDTTGDGLANVIGIDTTGDGKIDSIVMDTTGDGAVDKVSSESAASRVLLLDTSGDGVVDMVTVNPRSAGRRSTVAVPASVRTPTAALVARVESSGGGSGDDGGASEGTRQRRPSRLVAAGAVRLIGPPTAESHRHDGSFESSSPTVELQAIPATPRGATVRDPTSAAYVLGASHPDGLEQPADGAPRAAVAVDTEPAAPPEPATEEAPPSDGRHCRACWQLTLVASSFDGLCYYCHSFPSEATPQRERWRLTSAVSADGHWADR